MVMNRRGQGESGGSMIIFILIIVVAAVIGLGIYAFYNRVDTSLNLFDVESESMKASCKTSLSLAKTDEAKFAEYCGTFKYPLKVGGKNSYATCAYLVQRGANFLSEEDISKTIMSKCNSNVASAFAYNKCFELNRTKPVGTNWAEIINGVKCNKDLADSTFGSVVGIMKVGDFYKVEYSSL